MMESLLVLVSSAFVVTTNSDKQAMREAPTGLYCGPLRLLAMEVYDELNASGTFCNLITGVKLGAPFLPVKLALKSPLLEEILFCACRQCLVLVAKG